MTCIRCGERVPFRGLDAIGFLSLMWLWLCDAQVCPDCLDGKTKFHN